MSAANKLAPLDTFTASMQINNNGGSHSSKQAVAQGSNSKGGRGMVSGLGHGQAAPASKARNTHKHHRKPESSLNHLLNFSYARAQEQHGPPVRRQARSTPSFGLGSGYHPDDKAHFVNANYRFVVHPSGDYRPNLAQADLPVPWENVLQVLASAQTQRSVCPICLEETPIAPRMARCGHAFCLPCILRYLDSEDIKTGKSSSKWRKCPICFDAIYAKDLRPVRWFLTEDAAAETGAEVTLRLFKRAAGSPHALPSAMSDVAPDQVPWHNQGAALDYARLVRADTAYLDGARAREVSALLQMRIEDAAAFGDDGHWVNAALDKIEDLATVFTDLGQAPAAASTGGSTQTRSRPPIQYEMASDAPTDFFAATAPINVPSPSLAKTAPAERIRHQPSPPRHADHANNQDTPEAYYFYQPQSGAHAYLASLDIRLLKRAYETFADFPDLLTARVEFATTVKIDADLRRRTKYLAHLPLGCQVTFLECDWQARLPAAVLAPFQKDLDRRRRKRHDKALEEESARQRAIKLAERRQRAEYQGGPTSSRQHHASSWLSQAAVQDIDGVLFEDADSSYFARAASNPYDLFNHAVDGGASPASSPPAVASSSFEPRQVTVWGTAAAASLEAGAGMQAEQDDWQEQIARFEEEAAVSAAVESTVQEGEEAKKARPVKKQKPKKLVLMSTAGGRRA